MAKRKNGEGGISFDKSRNSYRASVTAPDGRRIFKRFKTKEEALNWKNEQLYNMQKGTFVSPSDVLLGEWLLKWLETYKKDTVKQRTYERYVSLAKHLIPLSGFKLQELNAIQVQEFYKTMPNLSACTINKIHKLLKECCTKAYQLEMVQKNIMELVQAPKYEAPGIEVFKKEEIEKILTTCKNHTILNKKYPIILLLVTTGARLGEILGLRWCDVFLASSEIYIRRSLQSSNMLGLILESPKTKASIRKIKITQEACEELKKLKAKTKNIDLKQEKLCFLTRKGTPISPHNFERSWKDLLRNASVEYKKIHTLRHTHATELLANGIPLSDVAKRLGHSKQSHTLELYSHALPNHDEIITSAIQQLYSVPK